MMKYIHHVGFTFSELSKVKGSVADIFNTRTRRTFGPFYRQFQGCFLSYKILIAEEGKINGRTKKVYNIASTFMLDPIG